MDTLVFYGNNNLQKQGWSVITNGFRSATGNQVQAIPLARTDGSVVVNTRLQERLGTISGVINLNATTEFDNFEDAVKKFDQVMNKSSKIERYIRFVPDYTLISNLDNAGEWTGSGDATNVTVSTANMQIGQSSIGFDIDVSASGNDEAIMTGDLSSSVNLSNVDNTGNLETSVYIPDVLYVSSIEVRIGSSSSDYYSEVFTNNYEGLGFENGWNHLSMKWDSNTSETGTVDSSDIDYVQIKISYTGDATDQTCNIGFVGWVNEDRLRNFPVFRSGELQRQRFNYNSASGIIEYEQSFNNSVGYAIGTHNIELFSFTGITASQTIVDFDLDGSTTLLPLFNVTTVTSSDVDNISITNLNENRSIVYESSGIADGETIVFGGSGLTSLRLNSTLQGQPLEFKEGLIPTFRPGKNYVGLNVTAVSVDQIPSSRPASTDKTFINDISGSPTVSTYRYISQSYVATSSENLTDIVINKNSSSAFTPAGSPGVLYWWIQNDNAGKPGITSLAAGSVNASVYGKEELAITGINLSQTSGSTYHVVFLSSYRIVGFPTKTTRFDFAGTTASTHSGTVHFSDNTQSEGPTFVTPWNAQTGDIDIQFTLTPTPAWDVEFSGSYRKLYIA